MHLINRNYNDTLKTETNHISIFYLITGLKLGFLIDQLLVLDLFVQ